MESTGTEHDRAPVESEARNGRAPLLIVLALGALTALAPLSLDMYLPALPGVADDLGVPDSTAQLTLTACLLGLAVGQLVVGPLSDALGRRRPLIVGMAVYTAATFVCAFATDATALIGLRVVQGIAGASGIVIARAIVRDMFDGVRAGRFFSTLMLVSGAAPVAAPLVGGQLLRVTDWRGIFLVLGAVSAVILVLTVSAVRESLPPERRSEGALGAALQTMGGLLRDRVFTGYVLTGALAFAALFGYISGSSFVVQDIYGASAQTFSLLFGLNGVGIVITGQINGKVLLGRFRMERLLAIGLTVIAAAGAALVALALAHAPLWAVAAALFVLASGMGLILPNSTALSLQRAGHAAGAASALLGTAQFLIGAVAGPLSGLGDGSSALPMAATILTMALAACAAFVLLTRTRATD
ncbi:MFS transporter [Nocardiopsis gilva YIM 90087]|uniref:MFS transporter n=1 Tax=Nocardiopsis gilva YIM 90087 TaxID=1235441 RepID=A0A223S4H8_9ACTN|nr:multidrug effflux MFS transporter [Nocardiopsis gilva]ASU82929.1 MFS transporter [Nocardiopsis gilva YIM 90087]